MVRDCHDGMGGKSTSCPMTLDRMGFFQTDGESKVSAGLTEAVHGLLEVFS